MNPTKVEILLFVTTPEVQVQQLMNAKTLKSKYIFMLIVEAKTKY